MIHSKLQEPTFNKRVKAAVQLQMGERDNLEIIFPYYSFKTYVVTYH